MQECSRVLHPEKVQKRVTGFIEMDRQKDRDEFGVSKSDLDPEGKRFSYYSRIPDNSSRTK